MERYFASVPEESSARPRIRHGLEVNLDHPVVKALQEAFAAGDSEKVDRYATVLYGQSMLAEGLEVPDFGAYSQAVYALIG